MLADNWVSNGRIHPLILHNGFRRSQVPGNLASPRCPHPSELVFIFNYRVILVEMHCSVRYPLLRGSESTSSSGFGTVIDSSTSSLSLSYASSFTSN